MDLIQTIATVILGGATVALAWFTWTYSFSGFAC